MRISIGRKLLIAVVVPITVSMVVLGYFGVRTISQLTTENVQQQSLGLVQIQAEAIKGELEGWGRVVETMLASQQLIDFFVALGFAAFFFCCVSRRPEGAHWRPSGRPA